MKYTFKISKASKDLRSSLKLKQMKASKMQGLLICVTRAHELIFIPLEEVIEMGSYPRKGYDYVKYQDNGDLGVIEEEIEPNEIMIII